MISIHAGLPEVRPEGLIQRFAHLERGSVRRLDGRRAIEMSKKRRDFDQEKGSMNERIKSRC